MAEDALQMVEQVTKEKDALHKEKTETLASLEDSKHTNQKLQNEVTTFKCSYMKIVLYNLHPNSHQALQFTSKCASDVSTSLILFLSYAELYTC